MVGNGFHQVSSIKIVHYAMMVQPTVGVYRWESCHVQVNDMMGLLAVIHIVLCEVKKLKLIMTMWAWLPEGDFMCSTGSGPTPLLLWAAVSWNFNCIALCALIALLQHWWLLHFILKLWECVQCCHDSMLKSLHQVSWCKILKISLYFGVFVHSWVQGKATRVPHLHQTWCLCGSSDALQKVSYINKVES
jgi:hypothetical protein